jgi:protein-tyrosine phosphatase
MIRGMFGSGLASPIAPGLYQGGYPRYLSRLPSEGIDLLVLCASELQPTADHFPSDLEIVYAPMDDVDSGPTDEEKELALDAADQVVNALASGQTVLVTCAMGRNRSGLVTALALMDRHNISGREAVGHVRARRPNALTNTGFVKWLLSHKG